MWLPILIGGETVIQEVSNIMSMFLQAANIIVILWAFKNFLSKPHNSLEARITALEIEMKDAKQSLHQGNDRFREQENTNEVLIHSVMALIEFEIQYCLTEKKPMSDDLKKARDDLHSYLARK